MTKGAQMGQVSEGADVARLAEIAQQLGRLSQATESLAVSGSHLLAVLGESWQGADLDHFNGRWSMARQSLGAAGDLLQRMDSELRHQAEGQRLASEATGAPAGGGGPINPGPGDSFEGKVRIPDWFPGLDPGPVIAKVMAGEEGVLEAPEAERPTDPGEGNVRLPEGADPTHPAIQELMQTARGRETLNYLADNGITVEFDLSETGAGYNPETDTMTLGYGNQDAGSVIHEASHAQWDVEGRSGDAATQDKGAYVQAEIDGEVEATAEEVYHAKEQRMDGVVVARDKMEKAYDTAYAEVIDGGGSPEEADQAGRGAIRERFVAGEDGEVEVRTSTSDKDYEIHYGDLWDKEREDG